MLDSILYITTTGAQWRQMPNDLANPSTAFGYFRAWQQDGTWQAVMDRLREMVRLAAGREADPSKAVIDSQSVKGGGAGGVRGYDGAKKVTGRKRHVVVDSLGLLLVVLVTGANADDGTTAPKVLARLSAKQLSRLDEMRGDSKYNNRRLDAYLKASGARYRLTVVERPAGAKGFVLVKYRWVVARTHAWMNQCRRNSKDYERTVESAEAFIKIAMTRLMIRRLAKDVSDVQSPFRYARKSS